MFCHCSHEGVHTYVRLIRVQRLESNRDLHAATNMILCFREFGVEESLYSGEIELNRNTVETTARFRTGTGRENGSVGPKIAIAILLTTDEEKVKNFTWSEL